MSNRTNRAYFIGGSLDLTCQVISDREKMLCFPKMERHPLPERWPPDYEPELRNVVVTTEIYRLVMTIGDVLVYVEESRTRL